MLCNNIFSKYFPIRKIPKHVLDLRLQYVYGMLLTLTTFFADQLKHVLLEVCYQWLGPETAFHLWISHFILDNLGTSSQQPQAECRNAFESWTFGQTFVCCSSI